MPIISIIIPVYKAEPYIRKCIDSILSQTFKDFECILIDDGSPDNCPAICDEYATKDKRFVVIHQKNAGVSAARNAGLDIIHGEWVGFVDSDDWCDCDMFNVLYENALKYNSDVSICGVKKITSNGIKIEDKKKKLVIFNGEEAILRMFTPNNFGGYSVNKLVRSIFFTQYNIRYDVTIKYMEDILLFYEIFKYSKRIIYYAKPYYNYFINTNSVTKQFGLTEEVKTAFTALEKIFSLEESLKIRNKILFFKTIFSVYICYHYIIINSYDNDNFYILKKSIKQNINIILFNFSFPFKVKVKCFLIFCPYLLNILKHTKYYKTYQL